jgi:hypothetical protein
MLSEIAAIDAELATSPETPARRALLMLMVSAFLGDQCGVGGVKAT